MMMMSKSAIENNNNNKDLSSTATADAMADSKKNNNNNNSGDMPADNDILCGKDKTYGKHVGNKLFRARIETMKLSYQLAPSKQEKMKITKDIVLYMQSEYGSRFVKREGDTWVEISNQAARDKVSHALRFAAKNSPLPSSAAHPQPHRGSLSSQSTMSTTTTASSSTTTTMSTGMVRQRAPRHGSLGSYHSEASSTAYGGGGGMVDEITDDEASHMSSSRMRMMAPQHRKPARRSRADIFKRQQMILAGHASHGGSDDGLLGCDTDSAVVVDPTEKLVEQQRRSNSSRFSFNSVQLRNDASYEEFDGMRSADVKELISGPLFRSDGNVQLEHDHRPKEYNSMRSADLGELLNTILQ